LIDLLGSQVPFNANGNAVGSPIAVNRIFIGCFASLIGPKDLRWVEVRDHFFRRGNWTNSKIRKL